MKVPIRSLTIGKMLSIDGFLSFIQLSAYNAYGEETPPVIKQRKAWI